MIAKLMTEVQKLAEDEMQRGLKDKGEFHSMHEASAVILEEIDELKDEVLEVDSFYSVLWDEIKIDCDKRMLVVSLINLEKHAMMAACEAIQVAAMARKARQ